MQIPLTPGELETARHSVSKGKSFGGDGWTDDMIRTYKLNITTRERGRPKKVPDTIYLGVQVLTRI